MLRTMMKSKIHRATVSDANLHYVGSITLDTELMALADIREWEQVTIVDIDEKSLQEQGRWTWPRRTLARLVERIVDDGFLLPKDVQLAEHAGPVGRSPVPPGRAAPSDEVVRLVRAARRQQPQPGLPQRQHGVDPDVFDHGAGCFADRAERIDRQARQRAARPWNRRERRHPAALSRI